jgi:hypothetical protein
MRENRSLGGQVSLGVRRVRRGSAKGPFQAGSAAQLVSCLPLGAAKISA